MTNTRTFKQFFSVTALSLMISAAYGATAANEPTYIFKRPLPTLVVTQSASSPGGGGASPAPNLFYSTDQLLFGITQVGSPSTKSFLITNIGDSSANLNPGVSLRNSLGVFGNLQTSCTSVLLPGSNCSVSLTFSPTDAQIYSSFIDVGSSNAGSKVINVSGEGTGQAVLDLSTTVLDFGQVQIGNSAPLSVLLLNSGNIAANFNSSPSIRAGSSSEFNSISTNCASVLAPGESCSVSLYYQPNGVGSDSGIIDIKFSSSSLNKEISLYGTGAGQAVASLTFDSGSSSDFGAVQVGSSKTANLTFRNTGNVSATGVKASLTGGGVTLSNNTCGVTGGEVTLAANSSCQVSVTYAPTAVSSLSGAVLTIQSSASSGTNSTSFTGSGVGSATPELLPTSGSGTDFGSVQVGSNSSQSFTFKNTGNVPATGVYAAVQGAGLSIISNTCGTQASPVSVGAGQTCQYTLKYAPTAVGTLSGNTSVQGSFTGGSTSLLLSGVATSSTTLVTKDAANTTINAFSFGLVTAQATGTVSTTKTLRVTNSSGSTGNLTVSGVSITGTSAPYVLAAPTNALGGATCTSLTNMILPVGASCDVVVSLTNTVGSYSGANLRVESNATSGAAIVDLPITATVQQAADPNFSNVHALLPFNSNVTSYGSGSEVATLTSPAALSNVGTPFGAGNSLDLASTGYVTLSKTLTLGSSDFTIESWVKFTGGLTYLDGNGRYAGWLMAGVNGPSQAPEFFFTAPSSGAAPNTVGFFFGRSGVRATSGTFAFSLNTWYHVATVRSGGTLRIFVNGTKIAENTGLGTAAFAGQVTRIGAQDIAPNYYGRMPAYLSNFRITTGVARYTSNFTVPSSAFSAY